MNTQNWEIELYQTQTGKIPFADWLDKLDQSIKKRIEARMRRIQHGGLCDHKSVGNGVYEFRFMFGSGYRVYFGIVGNKIILLLTGGDKKEQQKDIEIAQAYLKKYIEEIS